MDETVIQFNDQRYWLYAAVDPDTKESLQKTLNRLESTLLHARFPRELREKHDFDDSVFLIDGPVLLRDAGHLHGLNLRYEHHGNRNHIEHVFRKER